MAEMTSIIRTFGPLRMGLLSLVFIDMLLRPVPGASYSFEGLSIVPDLLAPVLSPILFMLLLLDVLMSLVYRSDKSGELRKHYLYIILFEFGLAIAFISWWIPYFKSLNF